MVIQMLKILAISMLMIGCVADDATSSSGLIGTDTCEGSWSDNGTIVCLPPPLWPPAPTGSRSTPAGCTLEDGTYNIAWSSDIVEDTHPAFSYTTKLSINSNAMVLTFAHLPDQYRYSVQWADAATADIWKPGDIDTIGFTVFMDCSTGKLQGEYTLRLAYLNPGHQVETWTLVGL